VCHDKMFTAVECSIQWTEEFSVLNSRFLVEADISSLLSLELNQPVVDKRSSDARRSCTTDEFYPLKFCCVYVNKILSV
jgi:hypothetical protein